MSKHVSYDTEARQAMMRGVDKLANAVRVTLGPRGRNVVIDKKFGSPVVTQDGVTVAKEVDLENPMENLGAQMANHRRRKILTAKLTLSADVLVTSGLTESDCLIELAVHLYAQRRITVENAVQISQLSRVEFDDAFARRRH